MVKLTFMGAGSTVFARNVLNDCLQSDVADGMEVALYDIDGQRLEESEKIINSLNNACGNRATVKSYHGIPNRKEALKGADFVINAIQVGLYKPCTVTDFEIPKKYGLRQTIGDTLGIGGIMRGLRTIPVMKDFADDMEEVCPDALFINYTNPMSILTGYMQRYTGIKTIGLCHSVHACARGLLNDLGMGDKVEGLKEQIAGINHMAWLLEIYDKNGNDLYPEIRKRAAEKNKGKHYDMVRYDYIEKIGYYCTESSEHNAEYNPFYIKAGYPELIEKFNIPLDEYPRRCEGQIADWANEYKRILEDDAPVRKRSEEYASHIIEAIVNNKVYKFGGNVINNGLIKNLPDEACVEIFCYADNSGINPVYVGNIPLQCAAMNQSHVNVHLLTIEAAVTLKKEHIYHAAMMDPHTAAELSIDDIRAMVDDLIEEHGTWLPKYK